MNLVAKNLKKYLENAGIEPSASEAQTSRLERLRQDGSRAGAHPAILQTCNCIAQKFSNLEK